MVAYRGPMDILTFDELLNPNNSVEFEGADHGGAGASFFYLNAEPGRGPSLHKHDYPEICVTLEGQATFHGPGGEVEIGPDHVVVVPAGEPHGFKSSGHVPLRQLNIHVSPRLISQWLDEASDG
jgi:mannose-6-phosphate isomerase-like protein (cupin superfamily)